LEAYDRNQNFISDPVILPEPLSADWPTAGFRQLVEDHKSILPKITSEQIEAYFIYRLAGKILWTHNHNENKNLKKNNYYLLITSKCTISNMTYLGNTTITIFRSAYFLYR
jgi:hypothetical protein